MCGHAVLHVSVYISMVSDCRTLADTCMHAVVECDWSINDHFTRPIFEHKYIQA